MPYQSPEVCIREDMPKNLYPVVPISQSRERPLSPSVMVVFDWCMHGGYLRRHRVGTLRSEPVLQGHGSTECRGE